MAITSLEYQLLWALRLQKALPPRPRVLELGESNWYADVPLETLARDVKALVEDPVRREELLSRLDKARSAPVPTNLYETARVCFAALLDTTDYRAIDPGTPSATYRFDLNLAVPLREKFDVTLNLGTAEHIFNVWQFFKTAHDLTAENGVMIHSSPLLGWHDHGLFLFQPTFYFDLARANHYKTLLMVSGRLGSSEIIRIGSHDDYHRRFKAGGLPMGSILCVAYQKAATAAEFATPMQGYYAGTISEDLRKDWREWR